MFSVMDKSTLFVENNMRKPCTEWLFLINKAIIAFSYQISYNRLILLSSDVS